MSYIEKVEAGEHVLQSYMPYAVSTIVDRALPDVRDGLKPVHRRILYQMKKGKMVFENERAKTMDPIAKTMQIHHHGDSSILDAIALMTEQNESLLHPFIDGEGAFGKVYSKDKPTPPRYTYCRLNEFSEELFKDVNNGIITMIGEDKDHMQPLTLSADFPNILIKNNKGIACGEACDLPSFNLAEICDATVSYIDNKDIDLFDYIKGLDFPTGAYMIFNKEQLENIYNKGKGKVILRSKYKYLEDENIIEIYNIPYNTTVDSIIEQVFKLMKSSKESIFKSITDIRDETGFNEITQKEEMKIAIDIKKNTNIDFLISKLFKSTPLEAYYSANMNCLVNCEPKVLGIKQILDEWLLFRKSCITKSLEVKLEKQKKDFHVLSGLQNVLLDTDKCINIIKNSLEEEVINNLMKAFNLDDIQAEFVVEMKLRKINAISVNKELIKIKKLEEEIKEVEDTLNSNEGINKIIKDGLIRIKDKYQKPRQTEVLYEDDIQELKKEDLIEDYNCRIFYTNKYVKKHLKQSDSHTYKEDNVVLGDFITTNKSTLLIFTNQGNRYRIPCSDLEQYQPSKHGTYIHNLFKLDKDEEIIKIVSVEKPVGYMTFAFENGKVAKVKIDKFMSAYQKLENSYSTESKLLDTYYTEKDVDILMVSSEGKAIVFNSSDINAVSSKNSQGSTGMKLDSSTIISAIINVNKDINFELTTLKGKVKEFTLSDIAPTNKKNEDRDLYTYLYSKRANQGNFLINTRTNQDEIIELVVK